MVVYGIKLGCEDSEVGDAEVQAVGVATPSDGIVKGPAVSVCSCAGCLAKPLIKSCVVMICKGMLGLMVH